MRLLVPILLSIMLAVPAVADVLADIDDSDEAARMAELYGLKHWILSGEDISYIGNMNSRVYFYSQKIEEVIKQAMLNYINSETECK